MSEKDIQNSLDLARVKLEEAEQMTKTEAIRSLNHAGILTTKGEFKKDYQPLEEIVDK